MGNGAGSLRERVTLQTRQSGRDAAGQKSTSWVDGDTVWANVRWISGVEAIKADAEAAMKRASIRIRYRSDVTETMRVKHGATILQIKAALPSEDRAWLNLACEAVSNG